MASNRGNNERFKRLLYSGYKMSLEKDIARLLNETIVVCKKATWLQFLWTISVTAMKVNEFIILT